MAALGRSALLWGQIVVTSVPLSNAQKLCSDWVLRGAWSLRPGEETPVHNMKTIFVAVSSAGAQKDSNTWGCSGSVPSFVLLELAKLYYTLLPEFKLFKWAGVQVLRWRRLIL